MIKFFTNEKVMDSSKIRQLKKKNISDFGQTS